MSNLPNTERAVALATRHIQATWQQVVMGAKVIPEVGTIKVGINLRKIYADNIILGEQLVAAGNIRGRILAIKQIARDLETGKGRWDMKPMLLNGPKARVDSKGNRYNIIPFRHAVPGGTVNTAVGKVMPQDIYAQARKLKKGQRLTGTEEKYGPGQNPSTGYQHKNGRFEGMVKVEKTYERATQGKYLTFRRVSVNSDPGSWVHPGYKAMHIAEGVSKAVRPEIEAMIAKAAAADIIEIGNLAVGMKVSVQ